MSDAKSSIIFTRILAKRAKQDETHGGPDHDDNHSQTEWLGFIQELCGNPAMEEHPHFYYDRMIQIAATAVAALESLHRITERRNAGLPSPGDYVRVDSGFDCIEPGVYQVQLGLHGVFIKCFDGQHLLEQPFTPRISRVFGDGLVVDALSGAGEGVGDV